MDLIVIGLWKLKRQMNNIMRNHSPDFYKKNLDQISEEIKILQKEQIYCGNTLDSHNHVFGKVSEEINILQDM